MSPSPTEHAVAIAGKDFFQILSVSQDNITVTQDLTKGSQGNRDLDKSQPVTGLSWGRHHEYRRSIAKATLGGNVFIYNIDSNVNKPIVRFSDGGRVFHSITFHPHISHNLVTSANDGSTKVWDLRQHNSNAKRKSYASQNAAISFLKSGDGAREVRCSPFDSTRYAVIYDSGAIYTWDSRNPKHPERRINAHTRYGVSIDWHEEYNYIVSGGKDKQIQIWNMSPESTSRTPDHVIMNPAPVSKVRWQYDILQSSKSTKYGVLDTEIACCNLSTFDYSVYVWNLKRPFIPHYVVDSHTQPVNDVFWRSHNTLWSISKDKTFAQSVLDPTETVIKHLNPQAISWSNQDTISFVQQNRDEDIYEKDYDPAESENYHGISSKPPSLYDESQTEEKKDQESIYSGKDLDSFPEKRQGPDEAKNEKPTFNIRNKAAESKKNNNTQSNISEKTIGSNIKEPHKSVLSAPQYSPSQSIYTIHLSDISPAAFHYCADNYIYFDTPLDSTDLNDEHFLSATQIRSSTTGLRAVEICGHNASVAANAGRFRTSQTWNILQEVIGKERIAFFEYESKKKHAMQQQKQPIKGHLKDFASKISESLKSSESSPIMVGVDEIIRESETPGRGSSTLKNISTGDDNIEEPVSPDFKLDDNNTITRKIDLENINMEDSKGNVNSLSSSCETTSSYQSELSDTPPIPINIATKTDNVLAQQSLNNLASSSNMRSIPSDKHPESAMNTGNVMTDLRRAVPDYAGYISDGSSSNLKGLNYDEPSQRQPLLSSRFFNNLSDGEAKNSRLSKNGRAKNSNNSFDLSFSDDDIDDEYDTSRSKQSQKSGKLFQKNDKASIISASGNESSLSALSDDNSILSDDDEDGELSNDNDTVRSFTSRLFKNGAINESGILNYVQRQKPENSHIRHPRRRRQSKHERDFSVHENMQVNNFPPSKMAATGQALVSDSLTFRYQEYQKTLEHPWKAENMIRQVVLYFMQLGDIQMCATLGMLFLRDYPGAFRVSQAEKGSKISSPSEEENVVMEWISLYLQELTKNEQYVIAAEIIKRCSSLAVAKPLSNKSKNVTNPFEVISQKGKIDTLIDTICTKCNAALITENSAAFQAQLEEDSKIKEEMALRSRLNYKNNHPSSSNSPLFLTPKLHPEKSASSANDSKKEITELSDTTLQAKSGTIPFRADNDSTASSITKLSLSQIDDHEKDTQSLYFPKPDSQSLFSTIPGLHDQQQGNDGHDPSCRRNLNINQDKTVNTVAFWYCAKCQSLLEGCTYCKLPVKGLAVCIFECGHTIHPECLQKWANECSCEDIPDPRAFQRYTTKDDSSRYGNSYNVGRIGLSFGDFGSENEGHYRQSSTLSESIALNSASSTASTGINPYLSSIDSESTEEDFISETSLSLQPDQKLNKRLVTSQSSNFPQRQRRYTEDDDRSKSSSDMNSFLPSIGSISQPAFQKVAEKPTDKEIKKSLHPLLECPTGCGTVLVM